MHAVITFIAWILFWPIMMSLQGITSSSLQAATVLLNVIWLIFLFVFASKLVKGG